MTVASILAVACRRYGFDSDAAEVIRLGENALYRCPGGVVVRIARAGQQASAVREIRVARWLASHGIPAVEALEVDQPLLVEDRPVTFWRELPAHRAGTPVEIAALLRRLHDLPVPRQEGFGMLAPFVRLPERLSASTAVDVGDREWLLDRLAQLTARWEEGLPAGLAEAAVHGDLWSGNLAVDDAGVARLLDLERFSVGPPEWDLVSTAIKHTSFGKLSAEEYGAFVAVYGVDVTGWDGYALLRDIRELRMTSYVIQLASENPVHAREARWRVDCLRGRNGPRPWNWTPCP
ncbi:aminoglycoside phosphotransferase family protein [Embleya sp. NPDC020630]|uniref:aminoglycoside phosphotransferase family protein n=1 Tax=Embleya sp. NPDC020630 TaxID=3363979 RepID=UPI0037BC8A88